ncbi:MAG: PilZ domain-containing protein [Thermogutta sp.]|uniref:PilZ domain-containing protein n=1 Tax=Thermogutta sp. TaxID=1962930 RepID=UPI0019B609BE|nr:PilZ domain-containing protein [Thermogutta sp.]
MALWIPKSAVSGHGQEHCSETSEPTFRLRGDSADCTGDRQQKTGSAGFLSGRCRDISRGGFSFYLDERPDFTELMALVSDNHKSIYLTAQVVYVHELENHEKGRFLVGCRFLGRAGS